MFETTGDQRAEITREPSTYPVLIGDAGYIEGQGRGHGHSYIAGLDSSKRTTSIEYWASNALISPMATSCGMARALTTPTVIGSSMTVCPSWRMIMRRTLPS